MVSEVVGPDAVTLTADGHVVPQGARKMIALYDYDPQENSPNPDADVSTRSLSLPLSLSPPQMELAFMTGDVIYVFGDMDDDGFFMGQLAASGARGLVPSNFLADAAPSSDPGLHLMQQQQQLHQQHMLSNVSV